jgi:hypothetical protein
MKFLNKEISPYFGWFIISILNITILYFYGFEESVITTLLSMLWYDMVVKK